MVGGPRAFSLVELLVVIAIISVLIALLLPALSGVSAMARRTKCLTQVQQVGETFLMYSSNNKDVFPVMPVPPGDPVIPSQARYGGVAGLFSLHQVGDGVSTGFGGSSLGGATYSDGTSEPLMASYLSTLEVLTCPCDREDRFYGIPGTSNWDPVFATALPKRPRRPGKAEDVIGYNISYFFLSGLTVHKGDFIWGDETNGPDVGDLAWYGGPNVPPGGATPNSIAAGSQGSGFYAPGDNHGAEGGNFVGTDGSAAFMRGRHDVPRRPRQTVLVMD